MYFTNVIKTLEKLSKGPEEWKEQSVIKNIVWEVKL